LTKKKLKLKKLTEEDLVKIADKVKKNDKFAKALLKDFAGTMKKEGCLITEDIKKRVAKIPHREKEMIIQGLKMRGKKRFEIRSSKARSREE
jgi:hypothetical protein